MNELLFMLLRFTFNIIAVWILVHLLYYPKSKRRDYYFTFMLISISVFFLIYLLSDVKLKIGFALGLFAIFGIIRYRTESMPVREMTYLFVIIAMSVINALSADVGYVELCAVNLLFISSTWFFESNTLLKHISTKLIQYDRIELIKPENRQTLICDLKQRTGLNIVKVEVGGLDFLRDMAVIKIYYEQSDDRINTVNNQTKINSEEWKNV